MTDAQVRVAHFFGVSADRGFSGHERRWLRQFRAWSVPSVVHFVLTPRGLVPASQLGQSTTTAGSDWPTGRLRRTFVAEASVFVNRNRFDILHIHVPTLGGLLAAPICRVAGRASVRELSLVGSDNPSAIRSERFGRCKLACIGSSRAFLCNSKAARDDCLRMGIPASTVHLIPNPVDVSVFAPVGQDAKNTLRAKHGIAERAFVVLFVGSIKRRKGFDVLVEVVKKSCSLLRNPRFVAVGPTSSASSAGVDDGFVQGVKADILRSGLGSAVRFVGRVDSDSVLADYYRMTDATVLPSRAEGLPNVVLESMATGTPVVASLLPGVTDTVIEHGVDGFLVAVGDVEGFASRLSFLEQHPDTARTMGERARDKIVRSFGLKAWETRLVELYQSLLR